MAKNPKHTTVKEVEARLTNYKGEHPSFKLMMIDWQRNHTDYYDNFKARIISGDITVFEEIFELMRSCVPADADKFINSVTESAANGDVKQLEETMKPVVKIAEAINPDKATEVLSIEQKSLCSSVASDVAEGDKETKTDIMQGMATFGQALPLFFLKDYKQFLALFGDKAKVQDPLLYSMYYFIAIDNGAPLLAQTLMNIGAEEQDADDVTIKSIAAQKLINDSIDLGYTRKTGWMTAIKKLGKDWCIKLGGLLAMRKGKSGKVRKPMLLEDIVPEKTEAVKKIIKEHLSQKDAHVIDIAYILLALQDTELVSKDVEYTSFHYAVQYLMGKDYNIERPQKTYADCKKKKFYYKSDGKHDHYAYNTINMLAEKFGNL